MPDPASDFWGFYLHEHSKPGTRALHIIGTSLGVALLIAAIATQTWWLILGALASGYLFAWLAHFLIEHNKPATFKYPLRSFAADWKLWALAMTGRLGKELERHGLSKRS